MELVTQLSEFLSDPEQVKAWGPVITGCITGLVGFATVALALYHYSNTHRHNTRIINEKRIQEEKDAIRKEISEFYAPLKQLREESKELYNVFAVNEKEKLKANGEYFRTINHLINNRPLSTTDQKLLSQIIEVSEKERTLLEGKANVVDKPAIAELFGRWCSHIRLLKLLYENPGLGDESTHSKLVYPLEVDGAIETEILKLRDRLKALEDGHGKDSSMTSDRKTVSYYDKHIEDYYNKTAYLDMTAQYDEFRSHLKNKRGARILDAGCGVGRDTRYFIKRGFKVESFDPSVEMVKATLQYPFAYCFQADFEALEYTDVFDGIWCSASILHVPPDRITRVLKVLSKAAKPEGIIFISLKEGQGKRTDEGRTFYYHTNESFAAYIEAIKGLEIVKEWASSSQMSGDQSRWLHWIIRKRSNKHIDKEASSEKS